MINFPLVEYSDEYNIYHTIHTTVSWGISGIHATQFNLLDMLAANFHSFDSCNSTAQMLRHMDDELF